MSGILSTNLFLSPCVMQLTFCYSVCIEAGHHCPGTNAVFLYYLEEQQGLSELVAVQ